MGRCKQKQRGLRGLLRRRPSITEWKMHRAPVSEMTYTVSSGTLNPSIPYHTIPYHMTMSDKTVFHNTTQLNTRPARPRPRPRPIFGLRPVLSYDRRSQTTSLLIGVGVTVFPAPPPKEMPSDSITRSHKDRHLNSHTNFYCRIHLQQT